MAIEITLDALRREARRLHDAVLGMRVTAVEDRPLEGGTLLAETLGDLAEELLAAVREVVARAQEGCQAAGHPPDDGQIRAALAACQESFHPLVRRWCSDLVRYERVAELVRLGKERGGEWQAWTRSVRQGAEACREPLYDTQEALAACWREIAERTAGTSVSVRTVNIGRQVTAGPPDEAAC